MKPLTLDCARVRQELSARYDGALDDAEAAFVDAHLEGCAGCALAYAELGSALAALATLSPDDLARLSQPLPGEGELDSRPFAHLVFGGLLLLLLVATGAALVASQTRRSAPAKPTPQLLSRGVVPLPLIGADVGVEREAVTTHRPTVESPVAHVATPPSPDLIPQEALLAGIPRGARREPVAQPQPKPKQAAPKKPLPVKPKPQELPPPLPEPTQAFLRRLRVSQGLGYRSLTVHFIQDPEGRERLPSSRGPTLVPAYEVNPSSPDLVSLKPPRGRSGELVLLGELLDAPAGLRIARSSLPLSSGRAKTAVVPVSYEGLRSGRVEPILKAAVLLPSSARLALITNGQPGAVALFLKGLTHNAFSEVQRLRLELARLESEAKALEQRLRARVRNTRGLRGVALSLNGSPCSIDLFPSSRDLAGALPKLLRTALLESHLRSSFGPDDESVDWASTKILGGENQTLASHKHLLSLLVGARKAEPRAPLHGKLSAVFATPKANVGSGLVYLSSKTKVFHAVVVAAPPR